MPYNIRLARLLRKRATQAERLLWQRLRGRQIANVKFRRQVPIGRYIVDFASCNPRLVIEIDGGQHAEPANNERDDQRDRWLHNKGFQVLRFWNSEVLSELDAVLAAILHAIETRHR